MTSEPFKSAYTRLPAGVKEKSQAKAWEAITKAFDDWAIAVRTQLEPEYFYTHFLNPATMEDRALDWRAAGSLWRGLWDLSWESRIKRGLLQHQIFLIENRYKAAAVFPKVFDIFGLDAELRPLNGFVLGANALGAAAPGLGVSLLDYSVIVPASYTPGTRERLRIESIVAIFGLPYRIPILYKN